MGQYLNDGHAEKVTEETNEKENVYYMQHRAVIRETSATTKLRVVFDVSLHTTGKLLLDDHLEKGPNLNNDLLKILVNFRFHRIALTADIQKDFFKSA